MISLASVLLALGTLALADQSFRIGGYKPTAFAAKSPNTVTSNVLPLSRKSGAISHAYLQAIRNRNEVNGVYGVAPVKEVEMSQVFLAPVKFGTETFEAVIDTGSSDTWLAETGFQCVNVTTSAPQPEADCLFGPTYSITKTFTQIPDENFNITYADGEFLTGILGREQVTLAGITVFNQEVAVVDYAAWFGDGVSSGLIGLAFPAITSAYAGDDPTVDSSSTQEIYNPIFTNMYTEGKVAPLFSLALDRGTGSGGQLAIGGLPPVAFRPPFATSPFQILTMEDASSTSAGQPQYQFYTITIQGFEILGSRFTYISNGGYPNPFQAPDDPESEQVIVDSGTTLLYVATDVAYAVNGLFSPPAQLDDSGTFFVACDAIPPTIGIYISGVTFFINPADFILPNGDGTCISGVQDAGNGPGILGDVFLKNVLAVYDVGASEMRFAAREYY